MTVPNVFISYSHKDEVWKDRVVTHLRVLEMEGMLDVWDDRRIEAGDDWFAEIEQAINAANIAIFLVSANFLTSKFIHDEEVSRLLTRREKEGVRVIPIIVKPCAWTQVKWLSPIQARPKDGRALSAGNENQIDTDLAALAEEIAKIIKRAGTSNNVGTDGRPPLPLPPDKISLAKLPSTSSDLFGREKELKELDDAWNGHVILRSREAATKNLSTETASLKVNVMTLVAWGGVGKSALVNKWLSQMAQDNYRGAERVYGWSFYSQGAAEGRQVSADQFIASALAWFGDPDPTLGSPWDKGERLAELVKQSRALIILDGLEPLQNPPPVETGKIKDPSLTSLLRELARQNPGLVVISTRLAVDDLKDCVGDTVIERDLDNLSDEAGALYLKHLGVDGSEEERRQGSHEFGGHALALTLMGSYLKVVHRGDIRKRKEIPHVMDEQKQGKHARRVMQSYEVFLKGKPELDILRLMGLFDRPAEKGALDALRKKLPTKEKGFLGTLKKWQNTDVIKGLTDNIHYLPEAKWDFAVQNLRNLRLISQADPHEPDTLDCHPLLREHFGEQLKEANPAAWREGNSRLYEYYKASAKELPDTLQEMAPLFAAVIHGCQAGRHQEAMNEVYFKRIQRGNKSFNKRKLGAIGSELATLSGFFDGTSWRKPVDGLNEADRNWISNEVGFDLRSLGRLAEATQPIQSALEGEIAQKRWKRAATNADNLSELNLTLGDMTQSLSYAEQSVGLADQSGDGFTREANRAALANALLQIGRLTEAQTAFHEAEEMQKKRQPTFPLLYSLRGFLYCNLLLSQGDYAEVERRASQTLKIAEQYFGQGTGLLDIALDNLSLGRALAGQQTSEVLETSEVLNYLNRAVDGLRQAGAQEFIVHGLLARAEYYRVTGDLNKSQKDLDEAFSIATRGGMGLFLADCHLEYARLSLAPGTNERRGEALLRPYHDDAREHLSTAKEMIAKMGYHRRDKEVEELEKLLAMSL